MMILKMMKVRKPNKAGTECFEPIKSELLRAWPSARSNAKSLFAKIA
jgi:hypothetical protein